MNTATSTNRSSLTDSLQTVLTAPVRLQTYLNVTYLALTGLLGQLYFAGFIMGSSLGVGLAITLLGFPILVGTLIAVTGVASIEARLADWLVDVTVSDPEFLAETSIQDGILLPGDGIIDTVGALVTARSTWLSIAVIPLKFVFSLFSLIVLPTMAAISAVLLDAPFIFERQPLGITTEITVGSYWAFNCDLLDSRYRPSIDYIQQFRVEAPLRGGAHGCRNATRGTHCRCWRNLFCCGRSKSGECRGPVAGTLDCGPPQCRTL